MNNIIEFLKKYNFTANKLLGQNFLINEMTLEDIVDAAQIKAAEEILEIGPGIGNLTKLLAEKAGYVLAIEKDQRYFPILKDQLGEHLMAHGRTPKSKANVELVFDDATHFNFQAMLKPGYKVVANIPYYITGKIIEMLMLAKNKPARIVVLTQKEVAERIVAKAGDLSILAISVQLYSDPKIISIVPKEDFFPVPKVDSAILVLDVFEKPKFEIEEKKFFRIVRAAFSGKRKQIHNTLKNNLKIDDLTIQQIAAQGILDLKSRPQQLTLEQWYKLYQFLDNKI